MVAEPQAKGIVDRVHYEDLVGSRNSAGPGSSTSEIYPKSPPPITADIAANVYCRSPLVNSLIRTGATAVAQVPLDIVVTNPVTNEKRKRTSGYPYKIFQFVNPHMTTFEFIETCYSWFRLVGYCAVAIEETTSEHSGESVLSLYPLDPRYLDIVPDPDTGTKGYVYGNNRSPRTPKRIYLSESQVFYFKNFNPRDYWLGNIDLNALDFDLQIEGYSKKQLKNFYANASVINGVISTTEDIGDVEIRRLKREFHQQYSGARNAYRLLVLENGMTYEPIKSNGSDEFVNDVLSAVQDSHQMVLGVPICLLTCTAPKGGKLAEAEALMWKLNLKPWLIRFCAALTKKFCSPVNQMSYAGWSNMVFEPDFAEVDALRIHDLDRTRTEVARVNTGLNTPNELRGKRNEPAYTGDSAEFGDLPTPVYMAKVAEAQAAAQASASLSMPGTEGGRDQSANGEAQLVDQTGKRSAPHELDGLTVVELLQKLRKTPATVR